MTVIQQIETLAAQANLPQETRTQIQVEALRMLRELDKEER